MQGIEMKSDHGAQFIAARDSRNRKIPGLQIRNGKYYGYLWTETEAGKRTPRRFSLTNEGNGLPCPNIADAKTALEIFRGDRPRTETGFHFLESSISGTAIIAFQEWPDPLRRKGSARPLMVDTIWGR